MRLDVGDIIDRPLIGLDTATYAVAARAVQLVPLADAALADKQRELVLTRQQLSTASQMLHQAQRDLDNREKDYQNLLGAARQVAGKPPAVPLLLDPHTWLGALVGVVAGGLLLIVR